MFVKKQDLRVNCKRVETRAEIKRRKTTRLCQADNTKACHWPVARFVNVSLHANADQWKTIKNYVRHLSELKSAPMSAIYL